MSTTMKTKLSLEIDTATPLEALVTSVGSGENNLNEPIAAGQTNLGVTWACDVSAVVGFWMKADCDMVVKTNSSSVPIQTLNLVAGRVYHWNLGDLAAFFLTTDVTRLFVTTAEGVSGTLTIKCLYDATP